MRAPSTCTAFFGLLKVDLQTLTSTARPTDNLNIHGMRYSSCSPISPRQQPDGPSARLAGLTEVEANSR
jgi:hypothetical protein